MEILSENRAFGGVQGVYTHAAAATNCDMTFAVYMPPRAESEKVPCLWYLSGLTCTHENAMTKAGAQAFAAEHGLALIFPDTSPRGDMVADDDGYDLGKGAGFYVDATEQPWAPHFQMYSYIVQELRAVVCEAFAIDPERHGITGHSMGGHGALTIAMRNPDLFKSVSAFAPISHPATTEWGSKQLGAYLGDDEDTWAEHDATMLLHSRGWASDILVDQGASDQFLDLLRPEALSAAMAETRTPGEFRMQAGYDHSYYFVSTFIADHLSWHAERL
ncbi:MAG: S-formylglutathione hydrolase [Pseudomonadota bacterium]